MMDMMGSGVGAALKAGKVAAMMGKSSMKPGVADMVSKMAKKALPSMGASKAIGSVKSKLQRKKALELAPKLAKPKRAKLEMAEKFRAATPEESKMRKEKMMSMPPRPGSMMSKQ